ncbi:ferrous iron transport protein B [Blattabacterium cuenoti]|uniref:ferrous iron transport protein B n=1 Tax=Blattabacterium cuenoti TaxID=1653831 RepID=UPI00163C9430|nr:ferrous iron transport protein B [Blattabacterium cuenoti]
MRNFYKVALLGNPNVGKTSLFNKLTGLNQKIGNYLGVTVDKKIGYFSYKNFFYQIIDLPGIYSLYPSSSDEEIVSQLLINNVKNIDYPDKILIVADSSNIKKSLLLFQQIQDLGFPILLILNMIDEAKKKGIIIDIKKLKKILITEIILINAKKGIGIKQIKKKINSIKKIHTKKQCNFINFYSKAIKDVKNYYKIDTYKAWYYLSSTNKKLINKNYLNKIKKKYNIFSKKLQIKEILNRYQKIEKIYSKTVLKNISNKKNNYLEFYKKIDTYLLIHPLWGYLIFFFLLFFIFQNVFFWSEKPKELIEFLFFQIKNKLVNIYPGPLNNFILQGIFPGITTIISFIPQIFILLFFILIMEESGYLSRVIFLMDKIMRPFGLNGKSIVPMISSFACSIPAIMSTRHIENSRDRLITILAIPFITCSARLPVYTLIISLIIPDKKWLFIQLKGIVLFLMYLLGIVFSLIISLIFHKILKKTYPSYLIMEIPTYKYPNIKNILITLWIQIKSFILNAGKMILIISVFIWVLGSFGPNKNKSFNSNFIIKKKELSNSFLGLLGKKIEPIIIPLGYDWKIGIGLLSSFLAREVFVSTMVSVYNLETEKGIVILKKQMKKDFFSNKKPIYNLATGFSLLFFYAFSMQCMSTLSIIKKETKSWKWPLIQFVYMTILAYFSSFCIYQFLKQI